MNKEKIKESQLLRYSGVVSAVLAAGGLQAQSDIVLTVVDTTLDRTGQRFDIDLDTNGVVDFRITQIIDSTTFNITGVTIQGRGPAANQVLGLDYANYNYPFKLDVGDTIGPGEPFRGVGVSDRIGYLGLSVDGVSYPNSQFTGGVADGFLGVRFEGELDSLQQTFYGWIRVDVAADLRSVTIRDFAYVTTPDSLIRAGFGSPISIDEPEVQPQPELAQRGEFIDYQLLQNRAGNASLSFYDLSGKILDEIQLEEAQGSLRIPNLPKGILVAVIRQSNAEVSKKIVVY